MSTYNTRVSFDHRRDTAANFTSLNPILGFGEIGLETDTDKIKMGDGTTAWNSLSYAAPSAPAGSDTQFQYNNAGAVAGSAILSQVDAGGGNTYIKLSASVESGAIFRLRNYADTGTFIQLDASPNFFGLIGDSAASGNYFHFQIDDANMWMTFNAPNGSALMGDCEGTGNGTKIWVSDADSVVKVQATNGIELPTTSGAPSGTPTAGTLLADPTNNKLYMYNGSAWKSVTLT